MVHDYGPGQRFGSLHVEMDRTKDTLLCHEIIDELERACLKELGVHLVIHYDPVVVGDAELDAAKGLAQAALTEIDSRLTLHDFRMVKGPSITNLIFDITLPFDMADRQKDIRQRLEKALAESSQGKCYLVITFDPGTF